MNNAIAHVRARREQIAEELLAIRSLERGALSEQYVPRPGAAGQRGPYYVLSRWHEGRNHSRRVKRSDVSRVRRDLANHERFVRLCRELEDLTCSLGRLEREQAAASDEAEKKGLMSRRRRSGK